MASSRKSVKNIIILAIIVVLCLVVITASFRDWKTVILNTNKKYSICLKQLIWFPVLVCFTSYFFSLVSAYYLPHSTKMWKVWNLMTVRYNLSALEWRIHFWSETLLILIVIMSTLVNQQWGIIFGRKTFWKRGYYLFCLNSSLRSSIDEFGY